MQRTMPIARTSAALLRCASSRVLPARSLATAAISAHDLPKAPGTAGRYSMALYNAATNIGSLDAVTADVARIEELRNQCGEFDEFLRNPSLPRAAKRVTLEKILEREDFSPTFVHFMYVIADNGRTPESSKIFAAFQDIIAVIKGEVVVKVISAVPFPEWELALLKKKVKERFFDGKETELTVETEIDEELIGGMTIQVGDRFMDLSTRTELRKLQEEILKSV